MVISFILIYVDNPVYPKQMKIPFWTLMKDQCQTLYGDMTNNLWIGFRISFIVSLMFKFKIVFSVVSNFFFISHPIIFEGLLTENLLT